MGTRSVVAVPYEGSWRGRYVHWDGYPSRVGVALQEIRRTMDLEAMIRTLTVDHHYWSTINAEPEPDASRDGARFKVVPGIGEAGVGADMPDEWITAYGDNWGTEWCYVLQRDGIVVLEATRESGHAVGMFGFNEGASWVNRGRIPWDDTDQMKALES